MAKAETRNGKVHLLTKGSSINIIAETCAIVVDIHRTNTVALGAETANDMLRAIFLTAAELAEEEQG